MKLPLPKRRTLKIYNGRILTPDRVIPKGTVVVREGKIVEVVEGDCQAGDAIAIDARGMYISPGFIDMHVHGGGGHDFMDGTVEAFLRIAETHARYGTTALMPTTLTSTKEALFGVFERYKEAVAQNTRGARFLGLHLEGPYFAMSQRGAQDPRFIRHPDPVEYREILARSAAGPGEAPAPYLIKRWSAAPELEGAIPFARFLRSSGVLVALAHTDALYEEALKGFENGFTLATHFYCCMSGVTRRNAYRYAGAIECAYLTEMDVEVIADGVHVPAPLLQLIYKIKGPERTALVTDAMRAAGMPEGESVLGNLHDGLRVIVEDGVAKLPDRGSFAGSVATADRLVRTMIKEAGVSLSEAVRMITATPARILGVGDRLGALAPGMEADIVLFNDDIEVDMTIVGGKIIYANDCKEV
ncbi:MAG TPA: N-acetylglucosamine-6-phosphate deacetylase [Puia sp.]|nr:N-acetylglucosamine-6-phosphate deacetylase [Puia sp.]